MGLGIPSEVVTIPPDRATGKEVPKHSKDFLIISLILII